MRDVNKSNKPTNLSSIKVQVTAIFKKLIQLSEFERSEALKYIQQHLDHQTTTSNPAKMPKPVTKTKSQKLRLHRPNKTLAKRKHPLKIGVKLPLLKCRSCTVTAKTKSKLLAHMNESHTGTPISCRKCRCSFNSTVSYEWHLVHVCEKRRNAAERKYVCPECSRQFKFKRHLNCHLEGHKRNSCSYCDVVLTRRKELITHMFEVHSVKLDRASYSCTHCEKRYVKQRSLYYHLRQHFLDSDVCLQCGNVSGSADQHQEHLRIHESNKLWACNKCGDRFSRRQQYLYHQKGHERYICLTCNTSYGSKWRLQTHARRGHETMGLEPQMRCPYCPRAYHRRLSLLYHMRKHSEDKTKIHCKYCDKTFNSPFRYYKHCTTAIHDKMSPEVNQLVCESCGKQFRKKYVLEQHLHSVHNVARATLNCDYCEYTTRFEHNLERHVALHFSAKDFMCEQCGKAFSTEANLADHISYVHKQEKQLKCDKCSKLFKRNSELVRHKATHSDARPHVCGKCGMSYKRRTHLSRHELSAHNIVPIANGRRVQRLQLNDAGALIPATDKSKEDTQQIAVDSSGDTANAYFMMAVPDGLSNTCGVEAKDVIQIRMPSEDMIQIYGVDGLSGGDGLQELNIVDQLVSSLMPGKDVQVGECSYNEFGATYQQAGVPLRGDGDGISVDGNVVIPVSSNEGLKSYQYMVLSKR